MEVYVVRTELWAHDHVDAKLLGNILEGVFDSEEKAMEYLMKYYGLSIRDGFECYEGRYYHCDTDEGMATIIVQHWEVNRGWEDLA